MSDILSRLRAAYTENPASALDMLPELFRATGSGKIIELPCKVGDKLYALKGCFYLPHATNIFTTIIECEVRGIKKTAKGTSILLLPLLEEVYGRRSAYTWFTITAIGKTVFLTREAAEAALKECE